MPDATRLSSEQLPARLVALASLWPEVAFKRFSVVDPSAVDKFMHRSKAKKCGIYVLSFADGELYVGQTINLARRFASHRKTYSDITELHFWRFTSTRLNGAERLAIRRLQADRFLLRNVTHASGRRGASPFDAVVTPRQQDLWFTSKPTDLVGNDRRQERPEQRLRNRTKFERLVADPRLADLVPGLRRYVAWTIAFPRRTEVGSWSVSAVPSTNKDSWPRLTSRW